MNIKCIPDKNNNTRSRQKQAGYFHPVEYIGAALILVVCFFILQLTCGLCIRVFKGEPISEVVKCLHVNLPEDEKTKKRDENGDEGGKNSVFIIENDSIKCECYRKTTNNDSVQCNQGGPK